MSLPEGRFSASSEADGTSAEYAKLWDMQTYGNKHVLQLKNVRETDFGNYSCMADNSLGRQRGSIEVSGEFFLLLLTDRTCESKKISEKAFG